MTPQRNNNPHGELDHDKLNAARLWACHRWPYLAHALLAMRAVAAPAPGGFAIDESWRVFLDPAAVDRWTPSQLGFILNHVSQHLLRDHAGRARGFGITHDERLLWNAAADLEINGDLVREISAADRKALAPLLPKHLDLTAGELAEYYYTQLRDTSLTVPDEGSGVHGQQEPDGEDPAPNEPGLSATEAKLLRRATADAMLSEHPGDAPAGLERWAKAMLGHTQDWRRLLASSLRAEVAQAAGIADYSYRRLSRRAGAVPDVVLPAMVRAQCDVAIVVDTSGSMRDHELGDALRETQAIATLVAGRGGSVQVLACDTATSKVSAALANKVALVGGGGTDMTAGIEAALATTPAPQAIVVLTDGITPWPEVAPRVPVIVGLVGQRRAATTPSWARAIEIDTAN